MSKDPTSLAGAPQLPVVKKDDGTWAMELRAAPDTDAAPNVVYDRLGGIVRVRGFAVLRQGRVTELPIEIVLRAEDAKEIAAGILGEVGRVM
jgi:hypothetical protein